MSFGTTIVVELKLLHQLYILCLLIPGADHPALLLVRGLASDGSIKLLLFDCPIREYRCYVEVLRLAPVFQFLALFLEICEIPSLNVTYCCIHAVERGPSYCIL